MNQTSRSSRKQTSSYSLASGFKYRPGDQLHPSMHFVNFPDKLPEQYVKLGHILYNSLTTRYVIPTAVKAKTVVSGMSHRVILTTTNVSESSGNEKLLPRDEVGSMFRQNTGTYLPKYAASNPERSYLRRCLLIILSFDTI